MERYELYAGNVILNFNPDKHLYTVDDKKIDGVTSILGVINKPALIAWAANCAADFIKATLKAGRSLDEVEIKALCDGAKGAHRVKRDKAADIGTLVHGWIEDFINGKNPDMPVNPQVRNGVDAFLEWKNAHKVEFIHSERKIYSKEYNFAGTLDFEAIVDGRMMLGDIKTGSGIYDEMFFQTAAYQRARQEEEPDLKFEGNLIVNCRKDGDLEVKESDEYDLNIKAFLGALVLYRRINEMKAR
jgi:hypothetical protein